MLEVEMVGLGDRGGDGEGEQDVVGRRARAGGKGGVGEAVGELVVDKGAV